MLYYTIAQSGDAGHTILYWVDLAALAIEILAVVIIVGSIFYGMIVYLYRRLRSGVHSQAYRDLKVRLGRSMLLGLEVLIAADIVRTVALEATLESVVVLGLLVLIRIFLSWALLVEIEGRWPWKAGARAQEELKD